MLCPPTGSRIPSPKIDAGAPAWWAVAVDVDRRRFALGVRELIASSSPCLDPAEVAPLVKISGRANQ